MPGAVLAAGVAAGAVALGLVLVSAAGAAAHAQRLAGAADAAALAAADAASGAVPGIPCERADEVATAAGATVAACRLDDLIATIVVTAPYGVWPAEAAARAGPPP